MSRADPAYRAATSRKRARNWFAREAKRHAGSSSVTVLWADGFPEAVLRSAAPITALNAADLVPARAETVRNRIETHRKARSELLDLLGRMQRDLGGLAEVAALDAAERAAFPLAVPPPSASAPPLLGQRARARLFVLGDAFVSFMAAVDVTTPTSAQRRGRGQKPSDRQKAAEVSLVQTFIATTGAGPATPAVAALAAIALGLADGCEDAEDFEKLTALWKQRLIRRERRSPRS